jgi:tight adherence protein C
MATTLMPILAAALVFVAVVLIAAVVIRYQESRSKRRSLAQVLSIGSITPENADLVRGGDVSVVQAVVAALADRLVTQGNRARLKRQLAWAGKPDAADLQAAMDRKIIYGIIGLCLGLFFGAIAGGWAWLALPAAGVFGYYLSDILTYNAGLNRAEEIRRTLPDSLDLLNLCVESGISLQAGMARVAQSNSGPVAAEFGRVLQEMQLGVSRADAIEAQANRTRQEDLRRFVAAILQVDRLGVPITAVLREQTREMRAKRQSRAREQAQKVPVKILMPLMICLLPGLFIVILGPAVLNAMQTFAQ